MAIYGIIKTYNIIVNSPCQIGCWLWILWRTIATDNFTNFITILHSMYCRLAHWNFWNENVKQKHTEIKVKLVEIYIYLLLFVHMIQKLHKSTFFLFFIFQDEKTLLFAWFDQIVFVHYFHYFSSCFYLINFFCVSEKRE